MAVTASTPANLVIGAGDIYADSAVVGASQDDNAYTIDQEYFVPELNGVPGELIGTKYKTKESALLETTIPEVSDAILALQWPGSQSATVGDETTIDTTGTRRIPTTDYHDWELRVPGLTKLFSFFADNAINTAAIALDAGDAKTMAPRLQLRSTWDPASLTVSPHRIKIALLGS